MAIVKVKNEVEMIKEVMGSLINFLAKDLKKLEHIITERDKKINEIKEEAALRISKQQSLIEETGREIYKLFKANKSLLTDNGKKPVLELSFGKLGTRFNRPSVWAKNVKQIKAHFKDSGLIRFIKEKKTYSLDKIAMAVEPEIFKNIKDVYITQKEVFFVQPVGAKEEYRKEIRKIRLN